MGTGTDSMIESSAEFRTKVLHESGASRRAQQVDIDDALLTSGGVHVIGQGLVALRGDVLRLLRFFEREFRVLARSYGAEDLHYPVLLPVEMLEELHYFAHFPQHVTFGSHLPEDLPLLASVARFAGANEGRLAADLIAGVGAKSHALKPAVCLPCYGHFRDFVLHNGQSVALTMQNHVFRYEGERCDLLSRLWDFQVRDIVFIGAYDRLQDLRRDVMEAAIGLCRELDLDARIELAHDPFFLETNRDKIVYQQLGEVKYELLIELPHRSKDIAAGSFNLHSDFFASVYNIRQADGKLAETACMGFGMERWVYGFLSQKGLDRTAWPERVATWVEESQ